MDARNIPGAGLLQHSSTQIGVMAGFVTMVSQPFVQLRDVLGLAPYFPIIVAIVVSFLLAAYQVVRVQKACLSDCLILVPLVAMITFSSYVGTNQILQDEEPAVAQVDESKIQNLEAQIDNLLEKNELLRRLVDTSENAGTDMQSRSQVPARTGDKILAFFISTANGASAPLSAEEKKALLEALRKKDAEAQKLRKALQQLKAEQEKPGNSKTKQKAPLLKSW